MKEQNVSQKLLTSTAATQCCHRLIDSERTEL